MVVKQEFEKVGIASLSIVMGEAELKDTPSEKKLQILSENLAGLGFEILDSQKQKQIERVKTLLREKVQSGEIEEHFSLSEYLSKKFNKEYSQISRLFSEVGGLTVEQFFILQKIEKVKEWIAYAELSLSEIAWKLGYSSVAYLSAQFKKVTGMTPTEFKTLGGSHRKSLDKV